MSNIMQYFNNSANTILPLGAWYGGGFFVGINTIGSNKYAIICAPISGDISNKQWKTENTTTVGTTSLDDGWSNTLAMISAGSDLHPAASFCRSLNINGFTDWYLPSKNELNSIYLCKTIINSMDVNGDLSANTYWSSSEPGSTTGWYQVLIDGTQAYSGKSNTYYVRAVRRIQL